MTRLGSVLVTALLLVAACASDDAPPPAIDEGFLEITDCGELERLASAEVDRISSSSNRDVIAAATARFEAIVAHRDTVC